MPCVYNVVVKWATAKAARNSTPSFFVHAARPAAKPGQCEERLYILPAMKNNQDRRQENIVTERDIRVLPGTVPKKCGGAHQHNSGKEPLAPSPENRQG